MNLNLNKDKVAIIVALEEELPRDLLPEFNVFYSGVGKINATYKSLEIINEFNPKLIINYGTAGSLRENLNGLYEVSDFFQRDMDASELGFKVGETPLDSINNISFDRKGLSCGTGDNFVISEPKLLTDLVDMESYALAKVCMIKKIDFICFKYVSDKADRNASKNWKENVSSGKNLFKEKLLKLFN
jgi:adenosylhomocysteine nucleosidase